MKTNTERKKNMKVKISPNICGICEHPGATTRWHNQLSYHAHPICLQWIHLENSALQTLLNQYLPGPLPYRNIAQSVALEVIKKKIGDATLLEFKRSGRGGELFTHFASQEVKEAILDIEQQANTRYYLKQHDKQH